MSEFTQKARELAEQAMELQTNTENQGIFVVAAEKDGDHISLVSSCASSSLMLKEAFKGIIESGSGEFFIRAATEALVECKLKNLAKSFAVDFMPTNQKAN